MKATRWIWALGGVSAASLGVIVGACASDNSSTGMGTGSSTPAITFSSTSTTGASTITANSSGTTTSISISNSSIGTSATSSSAASGESDAGVDAEMGPNDAGSGTGSSSSGSAGDAECFRPPTGLHAEIEAGVYCPFSSEDGGKDLICAAGKHCCEPPASASATSTCEPASTTCPIASSTDWKCEGAPDCASESGTVCCGKGTIEMQAPQPHCGDGGYPAYSYVSGFTGSSCTTTCSGSTSFRVCSKTSECPAGESCLPVEPKGGPIGYCASGSGQDAGAHDSGAHDSGAHDSGAHDSGAHDAETHDAGNACVNAGGSCVALSPGSCPNGTIGSSTMDSCGSGLGLECCLPN